MFVLKFFGFDDLKVGIRVDVLIFRLMRLRLVLLWVQLAVVLV